MNGKRLKTSFLLFIKSHIKSWLIKHRNKFLLQEKTIYNTLLKTFCKLLLCDAEWFLLYQKALRSLCLFVVDFQAAVLLSASVDRSGDVWSSVEVLFCFFTGSQGEEKTLEVKIEFPLLLSKITDCRNSSEVLFFKCWVWSRVVTRSISPVLKLG